MEGNTEEHIMEHQSDDVLEYLAWLKKKYRSHVHVFEREAGFGVYKLTEQRLGFPLESTYTKFLRQYDGASFFQGHLQLLPLEQISFVQSEHPAMIVIGEGKYDTWAVVVEGLPAELYSPEFRDLPLEEKVKRRRIQSRNIDPEQLRYIYGIWDGEHFTPLHYEFSSWLLSTLHVLDQKCEDLPTELSLRIEQDGNSPFILSLLADISQTHMSGDAIHTEAQQKENLIAMYDNCLEIYPTWPKILCRKADLIASTNPETAQKLRLAAFQNLSFPAMYLDHLPSEPTCVDAMFNYNGGIEEKKQLIDTLEDLWEYRVINIHNAQEFELIHRIAMNLAKYYKTSMNKSRGCEILQRFISIVPTCTHQQEYPEILILLAEFLIDSGQHDRAEEILQPIIHSAQSFLYNYRAQALLQCAQIATYRQEPWCNYLFDTIEENTKKEEMIGRYTSGCDILAHLYLLKAEYCVAQARPEDLTMAIDFYDTSISYAQEAPNRNYFIEGSAYLGKGEIFVRQQKIGMVPQYYQKVQDILKEHPNEILTARMFLRRGFLELYTGQEEKSRQSYELAIETFEMLEMPLQKAWSLFRLAQAASRLGKSVSEDDRNMALRAQTQFYQLGCPTGVSAVDRFLDQPQQSLAWHMKTAHELQKKLTRTRKCIAPYKRSDGSRFERKLGAHQISIARCNEKIIPALISEIREQAHILGSEYVSDVHVALMCFTTAAEFLATNKSYEAAHAMVELMRELPENGSVHLAFRNAIARTINMNVVEYLLEKLNSLPQSTIQESAINERMLLFAAEILGFRKEKHAIPQLMTLLDLDGLQVSHQVRVAAILALGRIGVRVHVEGEVKIDVVDFLYSYLEQLDHLGNGEKKGKETEETLVDIQSIFNEKGYPTEASQEERLKEPSKEEQLEYETDGKQTEQEALALSLLLLGERKGLDTIAQMIDTKQSLLTRLFGEMVGRFGDTSYFMMLQKASSQEGITGMGALVGLSYMGNPRAIPMLLENLVHLNPRIVRLSAHALELITGHHENLDDSRLRRRWVDWWEENQTRFESGLRYRYGKLFGPEVLIDCLSHDSLLIRQHSYDELVIATGVKLHFDYDGPYQVQQRQIRRWRIWWEENKEKFPSGRWYFQGS